MIFTGNIIESAALISNNITKFQEIIRLKTDKEQKYFLNNLFAEIWHKECFLHILLSYFQFCGKYIIPEILMAKCYIKVTIISLMVTLFFTFYDYEKISILFWVVSSQINYWMRNIIKPKLMLNSLNLIQFHIIIIIWEKLIKI